VPPVRVLVVIAASFACVPMLGGPAVGASRLPAAQSSSLALVLERGAKVAIRRAPASRTLAVAGWRTPFGSIRRLRVVERRGDWYAVESEVLGNGVVGWVPKTARVRPVRLRIAVEADLSQRTLTVRRDGVVVFRRRVSIGSSSSPTPSGRFHVTDHIGGSRWRLGCCIVVLSGTQPRLPAGWGGGDRLGIHGRPGAAGPIGSAVSAGCLHATEGTLQALADLLPLGTPVVIHP
jgi:lipoprotein-anchoring transpeptidase ErfK/SrfK